MRIQVHIQIDSYVFYPSMMHPGSNDTLQCFKNGISTLYLVKISKHLLFARLSQAGSWGQDMPVNKNQDLSTSGLL